jgi:HD-GYP domain-containing protein (c-di-GMP phosphodiesterase class II)
VALFGRGCSAGIAASRLKIAGRGSHFDPDVLDAFFALEERFAGIAAQYRDAAEAGAPH